MKILLLLILSLAVYTDLKSKRISNRLILIGYTLIEYAYYLMAKKAGITMNECRIYESEGDHHFMTKRFDRVDGKKLHMQSLGALAHISYQEPGVCGYELAAMYMKELGISYKEVEQFYRRMVFNCLAVNQDDHVKNISFIMDRSHCSGGYASIISNRDYRRRRLQAAMSLCRIFRHKAGDFCLHLCFSPGKYLCFDFGIAS